MDIKNIAKMIYHIMDPGIYSRQFYEFMREYKHYFSGDHSFIFLGKISDSNIEGADNYCEISSFRKLFRFFLNISDEDRVILHSYGHPWLYILCSIFWHRLRRITWKIWGGDLYFYRIFKRSLKYRIYEIMRKNTIKRFGYVIAAVYGDYQLAEKVYGVKGVYIGVGYPVFRLAEKLHKTKEYPEKVNILLGNSADETNKHIEMLNMLAVHKEQDIKVFMPLSYGGNPEYISHVIKVGKEIFNDKFVPMTEFMPYNDYADFLKEMDVMFCLHDRQQAMGTIWIVLSAGGKVIIKEDVTTYKMFVENGLKVYTWNSTDMNDFSSLVTMPLQDRQNNSDIMNRSFSLDSFAEKWSNAFKVIGN